jgi:hypothetical protein
MIVAQWRRTFLLPLDSPFLRCPFGSFLRLSELFLFLLLLPSSSLGLFILLRARALWLRLRSGRFIASFFAVHVVQGVRLLERLPSCLLAVWIAFLLLLPVFLLRPRRVLQDFLDDFVALINLHATNRRALVELACAQFRQPYRRFGTTRAAFHLDLPLFIDAQFCLQAQIIKHVWLAAAGGVAATSGCHSARIAGHVVEIALTHLYTFAFAARDKIADELFEHLPGTHSGSRP